MPTAHAEERPLNIKQLGRDIADEYGVSFETVDAIVSCESRWVPTAYNASENSMGLSQINHTAWPGITDAQREDPEYSLRFLAEHLRKDEGYLWSCYGRPSASSTEASTSAPQQEDSQPSRE